MSIIHTVGVLDVFVHFDPPFMTEQKVDHPPQEDGEFMTRCSVGKLMTEKCIRGKAIQVHHVQQELCHVYNVHVWANGKLKITQ